MPTIRARVASGATIHADEASTWDQLHAVYDMKRVNHRFAFVDKCARTNHAESYFIPSPPHRMGPHHHVSGRYLIAYASKMAWREDHRRRSNGKLHRLATASVLSHPVSRVRKGHLQR